MAVSTVLELRRGAVAIAALTAAVLALAGGAPAPAAAASWSCDASALRGTLATAPPFEPVIANRGAATCTDTSAGGSNALAALPVGLSGGALSAATQLQAPQSTPDQQRAVATAAATDLRLVPLPGQIPVPALPPGIASFQIPGGPAVDLTPAIAALLTPPAELLAVESVTSRAVGQCTGGRPTLSATSAETGLRVLGNDIAGSVVNQAVTV